MEDIGRRYMLDFTLNTHHLKTFEMNNNNKGSVF